jgi:hypothetical protein
MRIYACIHHASMRAQCSAPDNVDRSNIIMQIFTADDFVGYVG